MDNRFIPTDFKEPGPFFGPYYTWVWNSPITHEIIRSQLDEFKSLGIRAIYILPLPSSFRPGRMPTCMEPEYLTPEFFGMVDHAIREASARGMTAWLYDEGGWPSGSACGAVTASDNSLCQYILYKKCVDISELDQYGNILAIFSESGCNRLETIPQEERVICFGAVQTARNDLMSESSVDRFISLTHEGYRKASGSMFGKEITAMFTDEPTIDYPPCPRGLLSEEGQKEYRFKTGRNFTDDLPFIFDTDDRSADAVSARIAYAGYWSGLVENNYYQKLRRWADSNDLMSVGHLDRDDDPGEFKGHGGSILSNLRSFNIPAVDAIWRQIFPASDSDNRFFPRFASSAAVQTSARFAASESFGVYGSGLTYDEIRWIINFQATRGINLFNFMITGSGRGGPLVHQYRPYFTSEIPGAFGLNKLNLYTARISRLMSLGSPAPRAVLYYPQRDIWADGSIGKNAAESFSDIGDFLEADNIDFEIADDHALINGALKRCTALYLPECSYMPQEIHALIDGYARGGGPVFRGIPAKDISARSVVRGEGIISCKRILENGSILFIYNGSLSPSKAICDFSIDPDTNDLECYEADPENGEIYAFDPSGTPELLLASGEARIIIFTKDALETVKRPAGRYLSLRDLNYSVRRTKRFSALRDLRCDIINEECSLSEAFSGSFSGEVTITADFEGCEEDVLFDAGDIPNCFKLNVNGIYAGSSIFRPHILHISRDLLHSVNRIEIIAANTLANTYASGEGFSEFPPEQLGYNEMLLKFERLDAVRKYFPCLE